MRILVIQTAFPGDAILTLPLIQKIHSKNPNSIIDVLCIPSTKILFDASPDVNSTIVFDKKGGDKNFVRFMKIAAKIRNAKYDIVYSPHRSARSAIIAKFSRASERISFDKSALKFLYTKIIPYEKKWHEVKRNLSLIEDTDEFNWKIFPIINLPQEVEDYVENIWQNVSAEKVVIAAPGSVWETKKYPAEYSRTICDVLVKNGYEILLIGGKEDIELAESIKSNNSKYINLCGKLNFLHSVYLMKKSKLVICNDSAPTHLAMCAGAKVITIYCSTVPDFGFYPYNAESHFISYDKLDCKPCGIHGYMRCPEGHFKCAGDLKSETVLAKISEIMGERYSVHN